MSNNKSNSIYMHTANGCPAMFDGNQIVIVNRYSSGITLKSMFRNSLKEIRDEQWKAIDWRKRRGYETDERDYNYIRGCKIVKKALKISL